MKKTINILLVVAVIVPVVLLFWPFAMWDDVMSVILRVIPSRPQVVCADSETEPPGFSEEPWSGRGLPGPG